MKNAALMTRNKGQSYPGPGPFVEEQGLWFRGAEMQFRAIDGVLILAFLTAFVGLVLLLAK